MQAGLLSREITGFRVPTPSLWSEGNIAVGVMCESSANPARSKNLRMHGISVRENREVPSSPERMISERAAQERPRPRP
jgi:hypothetical protein